MFLWCDGAHDPVENMRRDRALLDSFDRLPAPGTAREPVLRLFQFEPHGITLGYAQDPARVLDLDRCRSEGIAWAVRPTGGRAIFHAEEWTYSFAGPIDHPEWGGSLSEVYARTSRFIAASLAVLGLPVEWDSGRRRPGASERQPHAPAAACFASTARHELTLGGRKLVGSAQRRTARAWLQQGSILLGPGHARLVEFLPADDPARGLGHALALAAADATPHLGVAPPLERWARALEAVLPAPVRRLDAAAGGFLLTLPEAPTYTPADLTGKHR